MCTSFILAPTRSGRIQSKLTVMFAIGQFHVRREEFNKRDVTTGIHAWSTFCTVVYGGFMSMLTSRGIANI